MDEWVDNMDHMECCWYRMLSMCLKDLIQKYFIKVFSNSSNKYKKAKRASFDSVFLVPPIFISVFQECRLDECWVFLFLNIPLPYVGF